MADITLTIPAAHWRQIVNNLENMSGTTAANIEILQGIRVIPDEHDDHQHPCEHNDDTNGRYCERWMDEHGC